ncbi:porin family protein [Winogradskyella immobilis]|uniref:PorT family protein n=1 Tax=Winogradskyella immobilis TaxID=2816852 RepID=A0ABS8EN92_9FLAO|nr:porin family protein [Winogradskyella immobilis]MCC1484327.1 PorT family protein [Winogradskyella immobilis]MCG0016419.1 PorT family protein [Winogradskyella immobilis]
MRYLPLFFMFFLFQSNYGQDSLVVDDRYREDQFYASITYNILSNVPDDLSQDGFSTGFHLGFIRDMPFNARRNWSVGLGIGVSSNSYNQNLIISENANEFQFSFSDETIENIQKNKFTTYLIDFPLELRWRTSTATDYKFWRIYTGFKFSYLVYNTSKLRSSNLDNDLSSIDNFNDFQYGITLSAGYGTWNFNVYYGLNSIFDNTVSVDNQSIDIKALKLGLIFYIL